MYNNIAFFPNINALRFFAALLVIFHHGEVIRAKNTFQAYNDYSFFLNGGNAVKFFFVLSGFLITYLLLKERQQTKQINISSFYFRRVIRIWPLYFLLVIIGTLLLPIAFNILNINYTFPYSINETWYLFLLFIPSLVTMKYGSSLLEPLWSIGVEEWFYVIWAPLFKWIKKPLVLILGILALKLILITCVYLNIIESPLAVHFIKTYSFESMAIGGLGAYFLFHTKINIKEVYKKYKWINYSLLLATITYLFANNYLSPMIHSTLITGLSFNFFVLNILFLNIIVFCAIELSNTSWLNKKWLNFGGEISYGIYMYHMLVIFVCIHFLKNTLLTFSPFISFVAFYAFVITGTIIVSYISKECFEDFFMRFKNKTH